MTIFLSLFLPVAYGSSFVNYENNSGSTLIIILKIVFYLIAFFSVIFLAYYFTKIIANKSQNMIKTNNMEIIDIIRVGSSVQILMVRILNSIYILGINNNNILLIDKKLCESIEINERPVDLSTNKFNSYLEKFLPLFIEKQDKENIFKQSNLNERLLKLKSKIINIKWEKENTNMVNGDETDDKNE